MATIKSAIGLMLAIVMYITNGITSFIPGIIPDPVSEDELSSLINDYDSVPIADEIIVVEGGRVNKDERAAIQSLQGLVSRTEAKIFINYGMDSKSELQDLKDNGYTLSYTDENGNKVQKRVREEIAIAFQHEIDHLEGLLFTDKIDPKNPFKNQDNMRAI